MPDPRTDVVPRGPGRPAGGGRSPDEMREHVLDAAERVFATLGAHDTTVEDIATEAEVSRGTVYRVFAGRDDIIVGVATRAAARVVAAVQERSAQLVDEPLHDVVVDLMTLIVHLVRDDPRLSTMFSGSDRDFAATIVGEDVSIHDLARLTASQLLTQLTDAQTAELRPELPLDELGEHLVRVALMLITGESRWSQTPEQTRRYLSLFVAPAIVVPGRH